MPSDLTRVKTSVDSLKNFLVRTHFEYNMGPNRICDIKIYIRLKTSKCQGPLWFQGTADTLEKEVFLFPASSGFLPAPFSAL